MDGNFNARLAAYPHIRAMIEKMPRNLWYIFLPGSPDQWSELETCIIDMTRREKIREQIMAIQKLTGMPLRPNEPLEEVIAKARIKGRINNIRFRRYKGGNSDSVS